MSCATRLLSRRWMSILSGPLSEGTSFTEASPSSELPGNRISNGHNGNGSSNGINGNGYKSPSQTTVRSLATHKKRSRRFATLTTYDATQARLAASSGVEVLLVGDSVGQVTAGYQTTVPVTVDQMVYHTSAVMRGLQGSSNTTSEGSVQPLVIVDAPFMSYSCLASAIKTTQRLMQEGGGHMIKMEGGPELVDIVKHVTTHCGVPVCGHIGLNPQRVHKLGGYRVAGKSPDEAKTLIDSALRLQDAGCDLLVIECVPPALGGEITSKLDIPTIGIGAGPGTDSQVLVWHDLLGLTQKRPKFAKDFLQSVLLTDASKSMSGSDLIRAAIALYVSEVKAGTFPAPQHCYSS